MNNINNGAMNPAELFNKVKMAIADGSNVNSTREAMSKFLDMSKITELENKYSDPLSICMTAEFNVLRIKYNIEA